MATTLAPVDSREVVRCDHCLLVQFRTTNSLCRRCHLSLDEEEVALVAPAAQWPEPASTGGPDVSAPYLRLQDRKRKGHADAVFTGAAGPSARGHRARLAHWWRTEPSGRSSRTDGRSIRRGHSAFRRTTQRHADVQHPDSSERSYRAATTQRIDGLGRARLQPCC